jgi:hypothetical protein
MVLIKPVINARFAWAFFGLGSLEQAEHDPRVNAELEKIINYIEDKKAIKFRHGYHDQIQYTIP